MLQWNSIDQGLFPFNTKFRKFRMLHQMERTNFGLVRPEYSGPALMVVSTLTGLVISDSQTEMSLSIWRNSCPKYRSFISLFQEPLVFEQSLFCSKIFKKTVFEQQSRVANLRPRNSRDFAAKILSLTDFRAKESCSQSKEQ